MSNLWSFWSVRDLQLLLDENSPRLMETLEEMLPKLLGEEFSPEDVYKKDSLQKIVEAFLPSEFFNSPNKRLECLNRLDHPTLTNLAKHLDLQLPYGDFDALLSRIAKKPWGGEHAQNFLKFFHLPEHFAPAPKRKDESSHFFSPASSKNPIPIYSSFKQLKDYQFEVFSKAKKQLGPERSRFVIQMPTGSGKTRTSMEIVANMLNKHDGHVIWLAHSEELCSQAYGCFCELWPHLGQKEVTAYKAWGKHEIPLLNSSQSAFIVAGLQKLHAAKKKQDLQHRLSSIKARNCLIIVDEAHKTEAPTYKQAIKTILGDRTRVIGLTATPGRTEEIETKSLAEFYFNNVVNLPGGEFNDVIQMLRERSVLSRVEYIAIKTDINIELTAAQKNRMAETLQLPKKIVEDMGRKTLRNIEIIRRLEAECKNGKRILLFACSVEHSKLINSVLHYLGYQSGHIDGTTNSDRRRRLIEEFKDGGLQVLCNYGVLSTGFDAPNTDVVFITRPTQSPVLYSQMIGRGLRGPDIGGTEFCRLIDVQDNIIGFGDADRVYNLFEDYWN